MAKIKIERTRESIKLDGQMQNHLVFHTDEGVERASFFMPFIPRRYFLLISRNGSLAEPPRKHHGQIMFSVLKGSAEKVMKIVER